MPLFSKLFGRNPAPEPAPEQYNGYAITPVPQKESNGWRIAARIEKDGQVYNLVRADVLNAEDAAQAASVAKAKQVINEQGDLLFG